MRASLFALLLIGCAHRATGPLEVLPESARDLAKQLGRPTYGEPLQPLAQRSRVLHEPTLPRGSQPLNPWRVAEGIPGRSAR